jgi:dihydroflavonol-4-reductase
MAARVLVTGISGFVGFYCALEALRQGYEVRGGLRVTPKSDRRARLRELLARELGRDPGEQLSFAPVDLLDDAGWDEAIAGCRYLLHVASPVPSGAIEDPDALVAPARDGALRALRAAAASECCERAVLTSSSAAVVTGNRRGADTHHDESSWSRLEACTAYARSKTLAERAAWDYVEGLPPGTLELVSLCPGMIYGPVPDVSLYSPSGEPVRKLLARELPGCPEFGWAPVDVRDVALLHVRALSVAEAGGRRFCVGLEHLWLREIARILARHFGGRGYRVATWKLPGFLVKIAARVDAQVRFALPELGLYERLDCRRARELLDWQPRDIEKAIVEMGESLIELGMV